mmetsp:Transcript_30490/g.80869  ORF Transcript_30490/g.80869 Transcript_30490/m.80869 type:complete len:212 (+) Transcript_30490:1568-2203(+)
MALMPESSRECSMSAAHAAIFSSLPSGAARAADQLFCQPSKKLRSRIFEANARVRSPSCEYCERCSKELALKGSSQRGPMTLSAPLTMQNSSPLYSTTVVIRLRSDEKGISARTVKTWCPSEEGPLMVSSHPDLPGRRRRITKVMPTAWAASRKATSSGELPEKTGFRPSPSKSTWPEWHTPRQKKNQRTSAWLALPSLDKICLASSTPGA